MEENLILTINPRERNEINIDWKEMHKELSTVHLKNCGNIIVKYNEGNKFTVITEVYPALRQMQVPFIPGEL